FFSNLRTNSLYTLFGTVSARNQINNYYLKTKQQILWTILGLSVIVLFFILLPLSYFIYKSISVPLEQALALSKSVSEGDLRVDFDLSASDEVGLLLKSLKNMTESLHRIVSEVVEGSQQVANAGRELSNISQAISEGASEQASNLEEITAEMGQMSDNIDKNVEHTRETGKVADETARLITQSNEVMKNTVQSMNQIIEKILIVNEIARQTNILALNAAVEAARAGEYGKGFAVVAAEVRKLAERSSIAASEIDALAKTTISLANESARQLNVVVEKVKQTARLTSEVATISSQQALGAKQISSAIQELNTVVQRNASSSEQMAASSEELLAQAQRLRDTLTFFNLD
ncbi:MAG TPA: HAMP domain-containing methyl-accepting chemotaxis protein, partial [Salinivirgaceae bacterium]|nr:HAMP domain-containing methyl-accepting chemotaxis protein [Salinivirgaceae bacterium]